MFETFKNLKRFQQTEYVFLTLIAFFIPISWRLTTYAMIGLSVATILKGVFENGFKINKLQYNNKYPKYLLYNIGTTIFDREGDLYNEAH